MIVSIVRFKSALSDQEVQSLFQARAAEYEKVPGLREKFYLRFPETGEYGSVYVWDSKEDLERFHASKLSHSIGDAYRVSGATHSELAEVRLIVHPGETIVPQR